MQCNCCQFVDSFVFAQILQSYCTNFFILSIFNFCFLGELLEGSETCYDVKTTAGNYESEVSWTITPEGSSTPSCQKGDTNCCFTSGTYAISCTDSYGDGWNGYKLFVDEVQKCDPFDTGSLASDELIVGDVSSDAGNNDSFQNQIFFDVS